MGNYLKKKCHFYEHAWGFGWCEEKSFGCSISIMSQKISPHLISLNPPRFVGMTHFRIVSTIL